MRKDIIIKLGDEEIIVPVNFEILEKVERVYQCTAEIAAAVHLSDVSRIQRRMVSSVISLWVQGKTKTPPSMVNELVMTCSQKQLMRYVGSIQAGVLFSIRGDDGRPLITNEQFDLLVNGEDLPVPEKQAQSPKAEAVKKPKAVTSRKRTG